LNKSSSFTERHDVVVGTLASHSGDILSERERERSSDVMEAFSVFHSPSWLVLEYFLNMSQDKIHPNLPQPFTILYLTHRR